MVRKPEAGIPSRDDGIPPDDADERTRALADFFGADPAGAGAVVSAESRVSTGGDARAEERLASFFEQTGEFEPTASTPPPLAGDRGEPAAAPEPGVSQDLLPLEDVDDLIALHGDEALFLPGSDEDPFLLDDDADPARGDAESVLFDPDAHPSALDDLDDLFAEFADEEEEERTAPPHTEPTVAMAAAGAGAELGGTEDGIAEPGAAEPRVVGGGALTAGAGVTAAAATAQPTTAAPTTARPTTAPPVKAPRKKRQSKRAAKAAAAGSQPQGQFASTPRGVRAWSRGTRWAVGISVVLIGLLVAASVYVAQTTAAQEARLQAAVADFEDAADAAQEPVPAMDAAYAQYETTAAAARAAADSSGPAFAAVAGMADQPTLDAATAAHGALVTLLDGTTLPERPADYVAPAVDTIDDVTAAETARREASTYAASVEGVTAEVAAATAAVTQQATALTDAQRALGASLPATAEVINEENWRALPSFRDAVTAAAGAVGAAQAAGGSGDAELQAYAAAVTALRADQLRAEQLIVRRTTAPSPAPAPQPTKEPEPAPAPVPQPEPTTPVPPTP